MISCLTTCVLFVPPVMYMCTVSRMLISHWSLHRTLKYKVHIYIYIYNVSLQISSRNWPSITTRNPIYKINCVRLRDWHGTENEIIIKKTSPADTILPANRGNINGYIYDRPCDNASFRNYTHWVALKFVLLQAACCFVLLCRWVFTAGYCQSG